MPEFGDIIICDQGFKNVMKEEEITGFQLRVRISYYRGIQICLLDGYDIEIDGEKYDPDDVSFSPTGETFYEMKSIGQYTDVRWEFGDKAYLHVKKPGGLKRGLHTVKVTQRIDVPYLPFSTAFNQTKQLTIV